MQSPVCKSVRQRFNQGTSRPFVLLDNFRGKLDSAYIESFLTAPGTFPARVPNRGSIDVEPARFVVMMTNGPNTRLSFGHCYD